MASEATPYVGPKPFAEGDEHRFFGRDEEIAEVVSLIYSQPQVLVYAESGAGKTSLLNAGVVPQLRRDGLEVLPVARVRPRPRAAGLRTPSRYMLEAISYLDPSRPAEALTEATLRSFLESRPNPSPGSQTTLRVVCFDQLEEIFIPLSNRFQEEQDNFFLQIADAVKSDPLLRVVLVVREDNLTRLEVFAPLLPEGLGIPYRLDRLGSDAALAAIREPLRATPWRFEEGVAERLVEDLRKIRVETKPGHTEEIVGDFVEPVQLQVVCGRLWESLPGQGGTITFKELKQYGDVTRALSTFYESALRQAVAQSGEAEWKLRNWFDTKLLTPAGTRGIVYRGPKETDGISNKAVDVLEGMHLLRGDYRAGAYWYELTHDRFIGPIQDSNHRAQQPTSPLSPRTSRLLFALTLLGGVAAIALLILPWLTLSASVRAVVVKTLAVLIAALLPGWLYVRFLQTRILLLWEEYVLNLFRLRIDDYGALPEPPLATEYHRLWRQAGGRADDTNNLYLRKFEAARGRGVLRALRGYGRVAVAPQVLTVVVLFGLIAGVGWWFVLRPDLPVGGSLFGLGDSGAQLSRLGSALQFAFIGAYFTGLLQIIRDNSKDRLSAGTYIRMARRILIVSVAVVLLDLIMSPAAPIQQEVILAFLIGIFPEIGVQTLKASVVKLLRPVVPTIDTRYPLSDLEGLSVWDQAVFLEEGIEDLHGLVTANLVDLYLNVRVPIARLVDWLDQGFLYLHLSYSGEAVLYRLRMIGVRTATDLQRAWNRTSGDNKAIRVELAKAMGGDSEKSLVPAEMILQSISSNTNFFHVQQYRRSVSAETTADQVRPDIS